MTAPHYEYVVIFCDRSSRPFPPVDVSACDAEDAVRRALKRLPDMDAASIVKADVTPAVPETRTFEVSRTLEWVTRVEEL